MSQFLFDKIETLEEIGALTSVPGHIIDNLAPGVSLREYQVRGLEYFITYLSHDGLRKNRQIHNLFHMATGSGKTVMMAALILHLYKTGYRRFVFFVNQTTILEKTKANFLDQTSSKYLFSDVITIDGEVVPVHNVSNFAQIDAGGINICFTSVQKLHSELMLPTENGMSLDEFSDEKVVLLSDEAHHVNSLTKNPTAEEKFDLRSWEHSVDKAFRVNTENILLEFTATANLHDDNVRAKYLDKIIFDYPLAKFRESGYTKDFQNFQADLPPWERSLIALVLSEYRRSLATNIRQNIKPVVLMKSSTVKESEEFHLDFFRRLSGLTPEQIVRLDSGEGIYHQAVEHFRAQDASLRQLAATIKLAFSEDKAIIVNSKNQAESRSRQLALNSLEDESNPYRVIFAVEMLNEGWDVLNLFDIVRLYETRKSKNYTVKEAQLIGRGARYCPFNEHDDQERFTRKYDGDLTNPFRLLETMFFHSVQDSKYITELRQALKDNGLLEHEVFKVTYKLKDEFKKSKFWHEGLAFSNKRVEKSQGSVGQLPNRFRTNKVTVKAENISSSVVDLFGDPTKLAKPEQTRIVSKKLMDLPYNVLAGTADELPAFRYNILHSKFSKLASVREFLTSSTYMGDVTVDIVVPMKSVPSAHDWQRGVRKALLEVATFIMRADKQYQGTQVFEPVPIRAALRDKTLRLSEKKVDGLGTSQNETENTNLRLDLSKKDWYVFNDNFGTSEEKHFVRYLSSMVDELYTEYDEVYLVRNERFADLAIFDFETGERFEPDFLLFLREKAGGEYRQEQIYIEPKGAHLLEQDRWKEVFMLQLAAKAVPTTVYVDNNDYRIIGLPMYSNEIPEQMRSFTESFKKLGF